MKILIISHDPKLCKIIQRGLKTDFILDFATSATQGESMAHDNFYDALLVDMILPDMDGEELINLLKTSIPNLPIVALSNRSTIHDKERAYNSGADDYLIKPIKAVEIKMRLMALIRKFNPVKTRFGSLITVRTISLNRDRKIAIVNDVNIKLRRLEYLLLEFFMMNHGKVLSRHDLLESVWDAGINPFSNTVDVHIRRLREKIEHPFNEKFIHTLHGLGYIFE